MRQLIDMDSLSEMVLLSQIADVRINLRKDANSLEISINSNLIISILITIPSISNKNQCRLIRSIYLWMSRFAY